MLMQEQSDVINGKKQISDFPLIRSFGTMATLVAKLVYKFQNRFVDNWVQIREMFIESKKV